MNTTRRRFLAMMASAAPGVCLSQTLAAHTGVSKEYQLIAHRGGIVDSDHAENSPGSVQAAIDRGYWMLEVDIRRTKDGEPILQHDDTFQRFYGDPRPVSQVTWKETSALRSSPGNTSPIHFRDLCEMCRGRTRLMLDIKSENYPDDFYVSLKKSLARNGLLESTFLLGGSPKAKSFLGAPAYLSYNRKQLTAALERGDDVQRTYLFELASELTAESVDLCRKAGVVAVAAINTFRYDMAKRDAMQGAEEDAERMKKLGITHFQIDSVYQKFFI